MSKSLKEYAAHYARTAMGWPKAEMKGVIPLGDGEYLARIETHDRYQEPFALYVRDAGLDWEVLRVMLWERGVSHAEYQREAARRRSSLGPEGARG